MCLYDTWHLRDFYFPVWAMTRHVMLGIWWQVKLCKYNSLSKLSFDIWLVLVYFWLAIGLVLLHRHVNSAKNHFYFHICESARTRVYSFTLKPKDQEWPQSKFFFWFQLYLPLRVVRIFFWLCLFPYSYMHMCRYYN